MSHATPHIKAEPRQRTGTRYSQRLRREGKLPAVVYGHQQDPIHLAINGGELTHHLHDGGHLLEVEHDGTVETCLIKDVQYDYLGSSIVHVDLARVDLNEEIEVSVPSPPPTRSSWAWRWNGCRRRPSAASSSPTRSPAVPAARKSRPS